MSNLFSPPPVFNLPLSLGGDLQVDFVHKPLVVDGSNQPVLDANGKRQYAVANYPAGASVKLVIESDPEIVVNATINGSHAVLHLDHTVADTIRRGTLWAAIIRYSNGVDKVMCNGKVVRSDGR